MCFTHLYDETNTAQKQPVTTMLTYPWKCTVLHCNHLGNTWKPLVLMTRHFDYCQSEGDNQSVGSSAPVVSRCFPGGYNAKLYISRGRLAWWLLAFLYSETFYYCVYVYMYVYWCMSQTMGLGYPGGQLYIHGLCSQYGYVCHGV